MVILTSARASFARPSEKERPLEIETTIGSDYCRSLVRGEIIKGKRLMAMNSNFSWLLSGPVQGLWSEVAQTLCQRIEVLPAEDGTLNDILPRFWELNLLEMSDSAEGENESLFNKTVSFNEIEGRFTVQLLWKQDRPTLPSNLVLCKGRLRALVDRLTRNPKHLTYYEKIIRDQLREQVTKEWIILVSLIFYTTFPITLLSSMAEPQPKWELCTMLLPECRVMP